MMRLEFGCGMGPLLVLVSPYFRENVVVTCKIGSFLCSLGNLLQKNVIVFFLKIRGPLTVSKKISPCAAEGTS